MKKTFIACLLTLSAMCLDAQTRNVDSLVNILNTRDLPSNERLQLYWDIVRCYWTNDLDKAISYAKEGLHLSEKGHSDLWTAKFNRILGFCYMQKGDFDLSLNTLENAIEYAIKAKDKQEENIANLYIGNTYLRAGKHDLGLKYYIGVLPSLEHLQQTEQYANTLVNIAVVYQQLHNNDKALEYCKLTLAVAEKHSLVNAKMGSYGLMGDIYYERKQLDSALIYLFKAYEMSHAQNDKSHIVACTQVLAVVFSELKEYESAERYAKECMHTAHDLGAKQDILVAWSVMAKVNFELKRYKECEMYAYKVWESDSTHLERAENATAYICLANIFLDNPEKASYFFNKYQLIRNQLSDKSLHNSLADMEVKYETEKKEMQIATLEKERQLYIWLGVAGGAFLLSFIGILFYRNRLKRQQIKQLEQEKQLIATQAILDGETAERSRLARDLHDGLGGMLSVVKLNLKDVQGFSVADGQDVTRFGKALEILDESIGELRRVAHHIMPESLMRYGLKISLEDFCRAIPEAHFQYLGNDSRLDSRLEVMLYRCAYELINNAIKYAGASTINVQLLVDNGLVALTVYDNGKGFDPDSISSGSGLENIRTRVSAYNGKMNIRSAPGKGTEVNIEIESA